MASTFRGIFGKQDRQVVPSVGAPEEQAIETPLSVPPSPFEEDADLLRVCVAVAKDAKRLGNWDACETWFDGYQQILIDQCLEVKLAQFAPSEREEIKRAYGTSIGYLHWRNYVHDLISALVCVLGTIRQEYQDLQNLRGATDHVRENLLNRVKANFFGEQRLRQMSEVIEKHLVKFTSEAAELLLPAIPGVVLVSQGPLAWQVLRSGEPIHLRIYTVDTSETSRSSEALKLFFRIVSFFGWMTATIVLDSWCSVRLESLENLKKHLAFLRCPQSQLSGVVKAQSDQLEWSLYARYVVFSLSARSFWWNTLSGASRYVDICQIHRKVINSHQVSFDENVLRSVSMILGSRTQISARDNGAENTLQAQYHMNLGSAMLAARFGIVLATQDASVSSSESGGLSSTADQLPKFEHFTRFRALVAELFHKRTDEELRSHSADLASEIVKNVREIRL